MRVRSRTSSTNTREETLEILYSPPVFHSRQPSAYNAYTIHEKQAMTFSTMLQEQPGVLNKVLEAVLTSPGGKRTLSRLARTCKALHLPSIQTLWRELDSILPLISLFPSHLFKRNRRPGLGLAKTPTTHDWNKVLRYGELVRGLAYDDSQALVVPTIFTMIEEHRPITYILPHLQHLSWRVDSSAGLDRSVIFLNPELKSIVLDIGARVPQIGSYLVDLCSHTKLTAFTFKSPTGLPDNFTDVLSSQHSLERVALAAPGALSPGVGRWAAALPALRSLQIDLAGRSEIAVEGFFDDIRVRSGDSTPSSIGTHDSGMFSATEVLDFSSIRKSALRVTGDLQAKASFKRVAHLHLTGTASTIAVFLKDMWCPLEQLELVMDDPPDSGDWQQLCTRISECGGTLVGLKITATGASRFADLMRSTSRVGPSSKQLPLDHLTDLVNLRRIDIDLPESVVFRPTDVVSLAKSPKLEIVRLCPMSRFPLAQGPPELSLEDLEPLFQDCRSLHTVSIVVNAGKFPQALDELNSTSSSMRTLHVGNSWIQDPLQTALVLSQLVPRLSVLKWHGERNRPGFVEAHSNGWQKAADLLPHLSGIRLLERRRADDRASAREILRPPPGPATFDQGVQAVVEATDFSVQASPVQENRAIDARPEMTSEGTETEVEALAASIISSVSGSAHTLVDPDYAEGQEKAWENGQLSLLMLVAMALLYLPLRVLDVSLSAIHARWEAPAPSPLELQAKRVEVEPDTAVEEKHQTTEASPDQQYTLVKSTPRSETEWLTSFSRTLKDARRPCSSLDHTYTYNMSGERKQERDFKPEVDQAIPLAQGLAKSGGLQAALDKIYTLEKQTRNAADLSSTTRLCKTASELCYAARDYTLLNANVALLSKKHGQLKGAVQAIVEQALEWLDEIQTRDGTEKWLELVETLREVTEGKIYLETPRARVTLLLAQYHENLPSASKESIAKACDLLSDLQVETYSSMERREKTEFILEQMRLLIAVARQKDSEQGKDSVKDALGGGEAEWVKVRVGGRKVNEDFLRETTNEDLKLKYYDLMIQHSLRFSSYLDTAKYYYKIWETPSIKEDESNKGKMALEHIVYYIVLAPHDNEQSDMLHHLYADPALTKLELQYNLVKCFVTRELMRWPGIETLYGPFLKQISVFTAENRWEDLHTRVIEHNIRVVAQYYERITVARLTSLLDLTTKETEVVLARLVVSGTIWARVDRPAGVINFRNKRDAEDVMNDWSSDMAKLLSLVEKTWMGVNAAQAAQSRVMNNASA